MLSAYPDDAPPPPPTSLRRLTNGLFLVLSGLSVLLPIAQAAVRVGYVTGTEAALILSGEPAPIYLVEPEHGTQEPIAPPTSVSGGEPERIHLDGLAPSTRYELRGADGRQLGAFVTAPIDHELSSEPIRIALYGDLPHREDLSPIGLLAAVQRIHEPHLNLWLGRGLSPEFRWDSDHGYGQAAATWAASGELASLTAHGAQYKVFTASDRGPRRANEHTSGGTASLDAHARWWPAPLRPLPDLSTVWEARYGDVALFALDAFSRREGRGKPPRDQEVFGAEQLAWLRNALASSEARFHFVLIGRPVFSPGPAGVSLDVFDRARERLLGAIRESRADGVVLLTGGNTVAELNQMERPSAYPLLELGIGPLLAPVSGAEPTTTSGLNYHRLPGTLVREPHWALLTVDGPPEARSLRIALISPAGEEIWAETIDAADLR